MKLKEKLFDFPTKRTLKNYFVSYSSLLQTVVEVVGI